MIKYTIAMSIRTVCVISLVFLSGWWMAVALVGAIVLPYIAVVIANVSMRPATVGADRPGAIVPVSVPVRIMDDDFRGPFDSDASDRGRFDPDQFGREPFQSPSFDHDTDDGRDERPRQS